MTTPIKTLVAKLKRLNATLKRASAKREAATAKRRGFFPSAAENVLYEEANKAAGDVMRMERRIIEALLKEPNERKA